MTSSYPEIFNKQTHTLLPLFDFIKKKKGKHNPRYARYYKREI